MFDTGNPLAALRRKAPTGAARSQGVRAAEPFKFQIVVCDGRVRLASVNERGEPVRLDYRAWSGPKRALLKALADLQDEFSDSFAWSGTADSPMQVTLSGRNDLIELLLGCDNVVDAGLQPVRLVPAPEYTIGLRLESSGADRVWDAVVELRQPGEPALRLRQPLMLADGFVLADGWLRRYAPVGRAWELLPAFAQRLPQSALEPMLTLFASTFPGALIDAGDYKVEHAERLAAKPALLFDEVDEDGSLHLSLAESVGRLAVDFVRDYDVATVALLDHEQRTVRLRPVDYVDSLVAREALRARLRKLARGQHGDGSFLIEEGDDRYLLGEALAIEFLRTELPQVAAQFNLFGTEHLGRYRVVHAKPKLSLQLSHGIDFLDGDASLEIAGERFGLMDALAMYQKSRYISLADGRNAVVDAAMMERLERLFRKRKQGVRVSFFDLPLIEELIGAAAAEAALPDARAVFSGFNNIAQRRVPLRKFKGELRPYQLAGLKWLDYLWEHKLGGCLADDMGLGKTVQTIALLSRIKIAAGEPVLVVMPRSLLFNWSRELDAFAPELSYHVHHGSARDWRQALQAQVILTTYGTLRAEIEAIATTTFTAVVLDESQAIKNTGTQASRAVCALKARFRLALSGTPVENHLGELFALFRFLNPAMFHSAADFERSYARPIQQDNDPNAAHDLRKRVFPFILRRLKSDVLEDLPPKIEQVLYVEMSPEQKEHYERRRRFHQAVVRGEIARGGVAGSRFVILEAMLELRQIASVPEARTEGAIVSAKRERLLEAIGEAVENGHKCLVFCNFLAGVEAVCEDLNGAGIAYERMTGSTTDRQQRVERFQNDPRVKVFVMTLKTGGLGLNLTAADTVFIMDPWWNTAAEAQAVDRAHRIGQTNHVFTYRLIARDSIEEKIRQLQQHKQDLVDKVLTTDESVFKSLSEDDIEHLFNV